MAFDRLPNLRSFLHARPRRLDAKRNVRFLVMGSCKLFERLAALAWCADAHCTLFLDGECGAVVPEPVFTNVVTPSMNPSAAGPRDCCDPRVPPQRDSSLPERPWATASGPTRFFCDAHRRETLGAQYRVLPALAYVKRVAHDELRSGALRWLVVLDDDSLVSLPRLLGILGCYDESRPLHLGDFIPGFRDASSWERTFPCGGGGAFLSEAAVRATDFGACHERYRRSCLQSDWMLAGCLTTHGAAALPDAGCHACGTCVEPACEPLVRRMLRALQSGACLAAQYTQELRHFFFVANHPDERARRQSRECPHGTPCAISPHRMLPPRPCPTPRPTAPVDASRRGGRFASCSCGRRRWCTSASSTGSCCGRRRGGTVAARSGSRRWSGRGRRSSRGSWRRAAARTRAAAVGGSSLATASSWTSMSSSSERGTSRSTRWSGSGTRSGERPGVPLFLYHPSDRTSTCIAPPHKHIGWCRARTEV